MCCCIRKWVNVKKRMQRLNYLFKKLIWVSKCASYVKDILLYNMLKNEQQLTEKRRENEKRGHKFSTAKSNTIFQMVNKINFQIVIFSFSTHRWYIESLSQPVMVLISYQRAIQKLQQPLSNSFSCFVILF
jgi:hypothetical protein